jgi:CheY-like chemotaxis protein
MTEHNVQLAGEPIEILLVEDNLGDIRLTEEALRDAKLRNRLHIARDGVDAMEFLRNPGEQQPRPHLILLDLNLPRKDGREVLQELKGDTDLRRIPVVVLTTSSSDDDIANSYDLHANCYVTKPVDLDQFVHAVRSVEEFWFSIVNLPAQ